MNKAYIIFPLILTVIFGAFYYNFDRHDQERQAKIKATEEAALKAKVAKDIADRAMAIAAAVEASKKREIERKIRDLFFAGTRLVWIVYPGTRTAEVYTATDDRERIPRAGALTGDPVLPGYRLPLADIFSAADHDID